MRTQIPFLCLAVVGVAGVAGANQASAADTTTPNDALFKALDKDHSGSLDIDEFLAGFTRGKPMDAGHAARLGRQFAQMDRNNDGKLSLAEFVDFYHPKPKAPPVVAAVVPVKTPPPVAKTAPPVKAAAPVGDDEKDEVDQNVAKKIELHPWTDYQRRSVEGVFLPDAATIPAGHFHYRILHVARDVYYEDMTTNLLGLDDSVKIGLQLGYGITDHLDVNVMRSTGRPLTLSGRPVNMDYWDILFKYRLCDQNDNGIADVSVVAGTTVYFRNRGKSDLSFDAQLVIERNFLWDRVRLGTGIVRAGLSSYEPINGLGQGVKYLPEEYDQKLLADPTTEVPERGTSAIPISCKIALSEDWQLFGELIYPFKGFRTDGGPSAEAGVRFNTHTHEFSIYVANTANTAFSSVITGGADGWSNLPVFGFSIVAHL